MESDSSLLLSIAGYRSRLFPFPFLYNVLGLPLSKHFDQFFVGDEFALVSKLFVRYF
jgi:hypothetical protein